MTRRRRAARLIFASGVLLLCAFVLPMPAGAVDPDFMSVQSKLVASDGQDAEFFGNAVAVSGNYAVIGMWGDDDSGWNSGAAYVFVRVGNTWVQHQRLTAADADEDDNFGMSVAISGSTIVVGAPGTTLPVDQSHAGAVYVFALSGTTWTQQAKLTAGKEASAGDLFGDSVGIWRDAVVVGAPRDDHDGFNDAGSAYVFERSGTTWMLEEWLAEAAPEASEHFGASVAISGSRIVVGKPNADVHWGDDGAVSFYVRGLVGWTKDDFSLGAPEDEQDQNGHFGASVAIDGHYVIIGAPDTDTTEPAAGVAYIFYRGDDFWVPVQKLEEPEGSESGARFGFSVAIDGTAVVIGAPGAVTGPGATDSGLAFVFTPEASTWEWRRTLWQGDPVPYDGLGNAVAVSGETAMAGAPAGGDFSEGPGSVYVLATPVTLTPVHRFYRGGIGTHFYTPNEAEKASVIANLSHLYTYEGVAYSVNPLTNNQPLHRFYNKRNGSHFYTASEAEKASVIANLSAIYSYDGPTYRVSTAAAPGKPPVWRFFNKRNGSHFYTASEAEKNSVVANLSGTYMLEGIAFWLGQ